MSLATKVSAQIISLISSLGDIATISAQQPSRLPKLPTVSPMPSLRGKVLIPPPDKEATAKCDEGGDPKGPGACTWPNCNCPRYVGNQSSCTRYGCWHGYGYRKIFTHLGYKSSKRVPVQMTTRSLQIERRRPRAVSGKRNFENCIKIVL